MDLPEVGVTAGVEQVPAAGILATVLLVGGLSVLGAGESALLALRVLHPRLGERWGERNEPFVHKRSVVYTVGLGYLCYSIDIIHGTCIIIIYS